MKTRKHYTVNKSFRFYCLTMCDEYGNYVYVGKTTAMRISSLYSKHIRGNISATESYFDDENRPQLHILNELTLTTAAAYKYVVAYVHLFQKSHFICINHSATLEHANEPKPETLAIIQSLEIEPIEDLLRRTLVENPSDADRKPAQESPVEQKPIQMNIRIKPDDKIIFDDFRKRQHLNQQEAFSLLLDQATSKHYTDLLSKKDTKLQKLERENGILREKLSQQKVPLVPRAEQHAREFLHFAKEGISYYESLLPMPEDTAPLSRLSYRFFTRKLLDRVSYEYPSNEGFSIIRLEKVLWGNSRTKSCFLLGSDLEGHRLKLRYYSKEHHLASSFLDSKHAYSGAQWLVGYRFAKDQAMELEFAIPLYPFHASQIKQHFPKPTTLPQTERRLSLEAQIKQASSKK